MKNNINIIGRLGRDPEMRYTPGGKAVTNFSVATDRSYTNSNGEKVKETVWFNIETWGKQAETCNQYLGKGRLVDIEGRMKPVRIWTGNDGNPRADLEIVAERVTFLDWAENGNGNKSNSNTSQTANVAQPTDDDCPW